ncbi:MAG: hypothetical protein AAFN70_03450, partial [Planctomycetota bacterium]
MDCGTLNTEATRNDSLTGGARGRIQMMLVALTLVWFAGGATCSKRNPNGDLPLPPQIFEALQPPSADEITRAINRTDSIRQLSTSTASVKMENVTMAPTLNTQLAIDRPHSFRLIGTHLIGKLLDMGSNADRFWLEFPPQGTSQVIYFAENAAYQRQLQRSVLPVTPAWFIDALGLVHVDPQQVVGQPQTKPDGTIHLATTLNMPDGTYHRVIVLNGRSGIITEQHLHDPAGRLIASCFATDHRYYQSEDCSLPHTVRVRLFPAAGDPIVLRLEIGTWAINQIINGDPNLFVM